MGGFEMRHDAPPLILARVDYDGTHDGQWVGAATNPEEGPPHPYTGSEDVYVRRDFHATELARAHAEGYRQGMEAAAKVADRQAWAHGGKHFNGPELNSAATATAIRAMIESNP